MFLVHFVCYFDLKFTIRIFFWNLYGLGLV